ncbi:MAG: ABC transporter ATP-binding protein/permease [Propionibacteriaceae bacterium]|nr:ABC transporter ATP-binding protein/permease [Propionibacteriaceae bacterium]
MAEKKMIHLRGVSHRYSDTTENVLDGIDFDVGFGEFIAVTGPSGSGKSTLLNIIGLLESATTGEYFLSDSLVSTWTERERDLARGTRFGFVFQNSHVLGDLTVLENAALGLQILGVPPIERSRMAIEALDAVGMSGREMQRAGLLSGGERQRLAIARALVMAPDVVLADEPTGNLDGANGRAVIALLRELHVGGRTVIIVTHDPVIAAAADRCIVLRDGRIVADDSARQGPAIPSARLDLHRSLVRQNFGQRLAEDGSSALAAWRYRPFRTVLLLLAFALGIAGMVAAEGLSQSAAAQVSDRFTEAALDQVVVKVVHNADVWHSDNRRLAELQDRLSKLPRVQEAVWTAEVVPADVRVTRFQPSDTEPGAVSVASVSANYFRFAGAWISPNLLELLDDGTGVVVSAGAAELLDVPRDGPVPPGVSLWIDGSRHPVIGVVEFPAADGVPARFDNTVFVSRQLLSASRSSVALYARTDPGFPEVIAPAIPLTLVPEDPGAVQVQTVADLLDLRVGVADDLAQFVRGLAGVLLVLACLAGGVSLHLSVLARTPEIALRRALGTSRWRVFRIFLLDGLTLGLLGGALGAIIGQGTTLGLAEVLGWQPVLPHWSGPFGAAVGTLCGLLASAVPAATASRRAPAQAIRE